MTCRATEHSSVSVTGNTLIHFDLILELRRQLQEAEVVRECLLMQAAEKRRMLRKYLSAVHRSALLMEKSIREEMEINNSSLAEIVSQLSKNDEEEQLDVEVQPEPVQMLDEDEEEEASEKLAVVDSFTKVDCRDLAELVSEEISPTSVSVFEKKLTQSLKISKTLLDEATTAAEAAALTRHNVGKNNATRLAVMLLNSSQGNGHLPVCRILRDGFRLGDLTDREVMREEDRRDLTMLTHATISFHRRRCTCSCDEPSERRKYFTNIKVFLRIFLFFSTFGY